MTSTRTARVRALAAADLHAAVTDPLLEAMNFLNEVTARYPDAISFAPGRPYEDLFDPASIVEHLDAYVRHLRGSGHTEQQVRTLLFQYGRTKGQINDLVAAALANDEGIHVDPDAVVVTVGAQEGMVLVLRALFRTPRDVLLVSSPCYIGITGAARLLDVEVVPVPEGAAGPDPEAVRAAARRVVAAGKRPRAFYVVPDFANPSGASMLVEARERLLEVAEDEGFLIVEDNPYGFFTAEATPRPTVKALDRSGSVVYLGSFAKTCFPGARVGYVVADQPVLGEGGTESLLADELAKVKSMITVNTSSLSQAVIGGALVGCDCRLRDLNVSMIEFYRTNLSTVRVELERRFPAGPGSARQVAWNSPDGGFFTVLDVPFTADGAALERSAREFGVLWTPMSMFFTGGAGRNQLRLSSSYLELRRLREGIGRLAEFIRAETAVTPNGTENATP